ncbi:GNAT family N-acetyltransferase [Cellulomonas palmilytica]|uniref:GNAT family N-acetyltransferase n=1 Tax=Cellulomonas palmilytica TaxID=2608402 RepID=UPI001F26C719|nr:GNAT family N-acetyltransferase [Cellulomonas palmilytica]UJP39484.1 GNAT family N-acetyltransferase [Cellulomonas palmilytica]
MTVEHRVRAARAEDMPAIRTVLGRAFHDDSLVRWALPDETTRDDVCAAWFGAFVDRYLAVGRVDVVEVDGEVAGVAAWRVPDAPDDHPVLASLPSVPGIVAAVVGPERTAHLFATLGGSSAHAPADPAVYLHLLAVRPGLQGRGLGSRLVSHGLATFDERGTTTWLCTAEERDVVFYERLGFAVVGQVPLDDAATLRAMHRAPRAPGLR